MQRCSHADRRHLLLRPRLPLGLLGLPRPRRAALALRRPAALAPRGDRADRARRAVRASAATRPSAPPAATCGSAALRHALRAPSRAARVRHRPRLPRDHRRAPAPARARVGRRSARCSSRGSRRPRCSTRTTPSPRRWSGVRRPGRRRRHGRDRRPRGRGRLPGRPRRRPHRRGQRRPSSRARRAPATDRSATRRPRSSSTREDGLRLEAGGFQPVEAYDVVVANLDPTLERRAAARGPGRDPRPLPDRPDHPGGRRDHDRRATTRSTARPPRRRSSAGRRRPRAARVAGRRRALVGGSASPPRVG